MQPVRLPEMKLMICRLAGCRTRAFAACSPSPPTGRSAAWCCSCARAARWTGAKASHSLHAPTAAHLTLAGAALDRRLKCQGADGGARPPLTWQHRLCIAHDIARAVEHLHTLDPPMLHRDLKTGQDQDQHPR